MNAAVDVLFGRFAEPATYRNAAYLLIALPIGIITFTLVTVGLALSLPLLVLVVGVAVLALTMVAVMRSAHAEIGLANALLGTRIEAPATLAPAQRSARWLGVDMRPITSRVAWRAVLWFVLRLPLGILALLGLVLPPALAVGLVAEATVGAMVDSALALRAVVLVAGVAAVVLWPHVVAGVGRIHGLTAESLLGVSMRERLAEADERTRVAETRSDLARDLHDSVGHSLTASLMQARAARRCLPDDTDGADRALAAIEQQSTRALDELDQVLAVLRDEGAADRSTRGLADIPALAEAMRVEGQSITVRFSPTQDTLPGESDAGPTSVPPTIGRVAYRVVQEALTNVARHAPGASTQVSVDVEESSCVVCVANAPSSRAAATRADGGHGLAGLKVRVQRVGGVFEAGPTPEGGFLVRASLPLTS